MDLLREYARLIVKTGINIQKGQYVVIRTEVGVEDFASLVAEECYKCGAGKVFVHWLSTKMSKVDYWNCPENNLKEVYPFEIEAERFMCEQLPALIWIDSKNPDGLSGVDPDLIRRVNSNRSAHLYQYKKQRENKYQWTIAGYPSLAWAKKVFPDAEDENAVELLLNSILKCSHADDGNGIENWVEHEKNLKRRCSYLNSLNLRQLEYKSSNGTDLTIGLIPSMTFLGGGEQTQNGVFFQPNIPSEECFTTPKRGEAEGIVYASKPLVYQGQVIKDFSVTFKGGKAVEVKARENEELLRSIINSDENACYLGEAALVPYDSPINNTGLLFYNTLFDENAACHLALGRGFTNLYPDYEKYSDEELENIGINNSFMHVDFMIGDKDLNITGIDADGKRIPIFRNGNWAF